VGPLLDDSERALKPKTIPQTGTPELAVYFSRKLGGVRRLTGWERATHGYSDETIFVTLESEAGEPLELVIRRHQPAGLLREETDPLRHYRVLAAFKDAGIPVPEVLWYEDEESVLGSPFFVMKRVPGAVHVPWSTEGRKLLAAAGSGPIGRQFVEILARIHLLDWKAQGFGFLDAPPPGTGFALERIAALERLIDRYEDEPEPILEDALGWMKANAPPATATTLVHGDYRTGNLIYDGDRIAAVLDWEFCSLGDPALDVAWVLARSNRMDSDLVCFILPRERFLDLYREQTGWDPDPATLHFWELYHQVRHTTIWLSGAAHYVEGRTRDLRLARMAYALPVMRQMVSDLLDYR
jgi:aminoglycoside phosphotransferase (APT) family kinase protein